MDRRPIFFLLAVLILTGCNQRDAKARKDYLQPASPLDESEYGRSLAGEEEIDARSPDKTGDYEEKIIKNAYTSIRSSNVSEAFEKTIALVEKYDAIIINSSNNNYTDMDEAQLLIKILPVHFMPMLSDLGAIGRIESKTITEEDISEEYYDIKARLTNARKVQERLYNILYKSNKVEDILKVEHEIERVGEKIETLEGKIKYYDSKVDYSRISINIYSRKARFINLNGIGNGFKTAAQFAIHFFFLIIWAIIVIIPLIVMIVIIRPVITLIVRKMKKKKA